MSECNGAFKARKRGGLQNQIYELNKQIDNMKRYLSSIVQRHGYDNVRDFYSTYYAAKGEYADYVKDVEEWNVNHVKRMRIFRLKRIGQIDIRLARNGILL